MIDVNMYFAYGMAAAIHPLLGVSHSEPEMAIITLGTAKSELAEFCGSSLVLVMKRSAQSAASLIRIIDSVGPMANLTEQKANELAWGVFEFEKTLREECQHIYTALLQDQGLFSAYHLVEKIDTAFSRWNRFSDLTKRDLEEAGLCMAFERFTGAGFHALRAVETELKSYVMLILQGKPQRKDWGYYVDTLRAFKADDKLVSMLDNIRNFERNPLMHPEDWLNRDQAIELFCLVQSALSRLIGDIEKKGLLPPIPEGKDEKQE